MLSPSSHPPLLPPSVKQTTRAGSQPPNPYAETVDVPMVIPPDAPTPSPPPPDRHGERHPRPTVVLPEAQGTERGTGKSLLRFLSLVLTVQ
jgi:hypothetical protein